MSAKKECVILLHGLGRTKYSLNKLASLLMGDYGVVNNTYPSRKHTIEELAKIAVGGALSKCLDDYSKVHFVTHSLGGILVRQYLSEHHVHKLGNVVMLNFNFIYSRIMPSESDGKVSVESSKIDGMTDHLVLPVDHTFMMRDRKVISQVKAFLRNGQFERDRDAQ